MVRDLRKRFAHQLTFLLLATTLAAGCAEPVDEASDGFKRCMEGAGFELQGQSAGFSGDGIGVGYVLAEPQLAPAAGPVALSCVQWVSSRIGWTVFLEG